MKKRVKTKRFKLSVYRIGRSKRGILSYTQKWYFKTQKDGKRKQFPLSVDRDKACALAEEIYIYLSSPTVTLEDAWKKYGTRKVEKTKVLKIEDIFRTFERNHRGLEVSRDSFLSYRYSLRYICKRVMAFRKGEAYESQSGRKVDYSDVDGLPLDWLDGSVIQDYKAASIADTEDEEEELTAKISCNSTIRNARGLFSESAIELYQDKGFCLPGTLLSFNGAKLFKKASKYFQLPPYSVIQNVLQRSRDLKDLDPQLYLAFLLGIHAGLRRNEIANARLGWFELSPDRVKINVTMDGGFNPKHGHGRSVIVHRFLFDEIAGMVPGDEEYILSGDFTERYETTFEELNKWLRGCGIAANKPTHELRKLWFSAKVKTDGLLAAQQQGGHKDPKITATHYADNQMDESLVGFWERGYSAL